MSAYTMAADVDSMLDCLTQIVSRKTMARHHGASPSIRTPQDGDSFRAMALAAVARERKSRILRSLVESELDGRDSAGFCAREQLTSDEYDSIRREAIATIAAHVIGTQRTSGGRPNRAAPPSYLSDTPFLRLR